MGMKSKQQETALKLYTIKEQSDQGLLFSSRAVCPNILLVCVRGRPCISLCYEYSNLALASIHLFVQSAARMCINLFYEYSNLALASIQSVRRLSNSSCHITDSIQSKNHHWAASSEFGTYRLCEQRRFRRACASAQSRQNLRCSLT